MQGSRGQEGVGRPNTVTSGDNPSKPTHSSMEVDSGNTGEEVANKDDEVGEVGEEVEVQLCSAHKDMPGQDSEDGEDKYDEDDEVDEDD